MKNKIVKRMLSLALAAGLLLGACGSADKKNASKPQAESVTTEATGEKEEEPDPNRPGAKWIDSGIYQTFSEDGIGEIRLEDDFAAYVNRDWSENAKIPDGLSNTSSRIELSSENEKKKIELIKGEKKNDAELTSMQRLFAKLKDWDARNEKGFDDIKPYIDDVMSISSLEELNAYYSDPKRNILGSPMVTYVIRPNAEDAKHNLIHVAAPVLFSEGAVGFFDKKDGEENPKWAADKKILSYALKRVGYSEKEAKELIDLVAAYEEKYNDAAAAYAKNYAKEGRNYEYHVMSANEVDEVYSNLPLRKIFKANGYDVERSINIAAPELANAQNELYTEENLEAIKADTMLHILYELMSYADREAYEKKATAINKLSGIEKLPSDDNYAYQTLYELDPAEIDKLFAVYCFDPKIKAQITELAEKIRDQYRVILNEEEWLSEETKAAAIEKLDNIKMFVCFPEEMNDYSAIRIGEDTSIMDAYTLIKDFDRKMQIAELKSENDGKMWKESDRYSEFGAFYMAETNSININAGSCGGDYYDPAWPIERKLGGICFVIAHEFTHAFDNSGGAFDKDGNMRDWWTKEDKEELAKRTDKLIDYYSRIVPAPQLSDAPYGDLAAQISDEAIADLGSAKCLLSIAKGYEDFDYETFFKQLGTIQKNARYPEAEFAYIGSNVHPVEFLRCNVVLSNYQEFMDTFDIKEGDGMYLSEKDRITVW